LPMEKATQQMLLEVTEVKKGKVKGILLVSGESIFNMIKIIL